MTLQLLILFVATSQYSDPNAIYDPFSIFPLLMDRDGNVITDPNYYIVSPIDGTDPNDQPVSKVEYLFLEHLANNWLLPRLESRWDEILGGWVFTEAEYTGMKEFGEFAAIYRGWLKWPTKNKEMDIIKEILEILQRQKESKPVLRFYGSVDFDFKIVMEAE